MHRSNVGYRWTHLCVVRSLPDVVADGELEGLVLVLLAGRDDARRVEQLQVLLRLWVWGARVRVEKNEAREADETSSRRGRATLHGARNGTRRSEGFAAGARATFGRA